MKFLGLMGVLLWLGTLLGMAGGAERMRVDFALLEKDTVGIDAPALLCATKYDADKKQFSDKLPVPGAEIAADAAPCICLSSDRVERWADGANSAAAEVWHLGQGPPRAS